MTAKGRIEKKHTCIQDRVVSSSSILSCEKCRCCSFYSRNLALINAEQDTLFFSDGRKDEPSSSGSTGGSIPADQQLILPSIRVRLMRDLLLFLCFISSFSLSFFFFSAAKKEWDGCFDNSESATFASSSPHPPS